MTTTTIQDIEPQSTITIPADSSAGRMTERVMHVDNIEYMIVNGHTFWNVRDGSFTFTCVHGTPVILH